MSTVDEKKDMHVQGGVIRRKKTPGSSPTLRMGEDSPRTQLLYRPSIEINQGALRDL